MPFSRAPGSPRRQLLVWRAPTLPSNGVWASVGAAAVLTAIESHRCRAGGPGVGEVPSTGPHQAELCPLQHLAVRQVERDFVGCSVGPGSPQEDWGGRTEMTS